MFERETRREKILEARNKELRLKEKTKGILGLGGAVLVIWKKIRIFCEKKSRSQSIEVPYIRAIL